MQCKGGAPALDTIRLDTLDEGRVLDAMHNDFIPSHALRMAGKHHEIFLSDSRRTAPEKLKTILRQPVTRTGDSLASRNARPVLLHP